VKNWRLIASGAVIASEKLTRRRPQQERRNMKKAITLGVLSLYMSVTSFGAEHVVTHSAKIAGKDTYKAAAYSAKETCKAGKSFLKIVF
jgi:hypothetical protein